MGQDVCKIGHGTQSDKINHLCMLEDTISIKRQILIKAKVPATCLSTNHQVLDPGRYCDMQGMNQLQEPPATFTVRAHGQKCSS